MDIAQRSDRKWIIMHAGREVAEEFDTEDAAWTWADHHIDDQVFDGPNEFSEPIKYRTPAPVGRLDH